MNREDDLNPHRSPRNEGQTQKPETPPPVGIPKFNLTIGYLGDFKKGLTYYKNIEDLVPAEPGLAPKLGDEVMVWGPSTEKVWGVLERKNGGMEGVVGHISGIEGEVVYISPGKVQDWKKGGKFYDWLNTNPLYKS